MLLSGQRAIVTGASRGIGRAIAIAFAAEGASLALCGLDGVALEDTKRLCVERGSKDVLVQRCDVSRKSDIDAFVGKIDGPIDVVVHNAGVVERARIEDTSEAAWDHVLDVNLKGPYLLTHALLPTMRARKIGRLIFIASISATLGTPRLSAYCASKHGLIGFMRAAAEELRDDGICAFAINPGSVDTDMLKGSGFDPEVTPQEIAGVALYLASQAPATMTGATVDVFG
jgi:2-hydroxycyclohexanecarboxyl-CoA dehydrogenase